MQSLATSGVRDIERNCERTMKKWLIRIAALLVAIIVILLVLPFLIPVAWVKDQIVAQVKSATGRDFAINGPTSLSFLPSIAIELNNVSFGNPPGMADKITAPLAKLRLTVEPFALLRRELAIDSFVLVDPQIALEVDKQGRSNWEVGNAAMRLAAKLSFLAEAHLRNVRLVNGTITYLDDRTGQKQQISKINAKLALPDLDSPMQMSGSADWNSRTIETALNLAQPRRFIGGEKSPVSVKVIVPTIKLDFNGTIASAKKFMLAGDTSLDIPSVRDLAAWTGTTLPATNGGLGPLKIDGKLDLAGSKVVFSGAQIGLDAIKAKGDFAVDASGAKPYLKGSLDVDKLDVNAYLPPKLTPTAASSDWTDQPIDRLLV
jgi:AsmA protein